MKGGKLTNRPCLHRAPYSAGEGMQAVRFLITVDRIPQTELNEFIDMEQEDSDEDEQVGPKINIDSGELLPVTVLSGFLGAGKTSLLTHVLQSQHGLRIAVIVNDMAEVNIDAALVRHSAAALSSQDKMVEMQNGCICCTLRGDLIENVDKLAAEHRFDYLIIESTGISEPMPVATTFAHDDGHGHKLLGSVARLDTLVTVVDAKHFLREYNSVRRQRLVDRTELGAEQTDQRTIANLLVDQVECANVLVLNKVDLTTKREIARLEILLKKLNPKARIVHSIFGKVAPTLLLNTHSFDMAQAEQMPGWFQELLGNHVPESQEYNIASFVFRASRPFHPKRLDRLLSSGFSGVLRSKGMIWIACDHRFSLLWGQAGTSMRIEQGGPWFHGSVDPSQWPTDMSAEYRTATYGDRRQELVFIGTDMKEANIRKRLESALVSDQEFNHGHDHWASWPNPFATSEEGTNNQKQDHGLKRPGSGKHTEVQVMKKTKTSEVRRKAAPKS